ncbi:hypothetical protein [Parasphingorhabdus cellanae]|uniref:DUF11 domain-containing protein n=1 Tax=Parasphingorhabdus cellanae TaxID=2806553 RepID=A0ABX7T679_9SPHN|nr:hypothetical protein [Parasphingorhabdus cellanae]QTD55632.1 hypothetical protein J4G78_15760 [Parasphingorhabdus cellanae]
MAAAYPYGSALAQTTSAPSGTVINSYARVVSISSTTVQLSSSTGFTANSRALIVQMKGASVTRTDSAAHGDITGYGSAGRFEYVKIISVSGNTVTLEAAPSVAFNTGGSLQMVSVPVFDGGSLNQNIIPQAWNGQTGGVIAFDVTGTLTLNANIDATGRGFLGGALAASTPFDSCASDQINYTGPVEAGTGNKGEGIVPNAAAHAARRGHNGNGGGGGNITDAGGGGGGNIGAGGLGGRELDVCEDDGAFGGLGGQTLDYSPNNRLFMGGGGGSGSEVSQAASGGNRSGGGLIFLRVGQLVGGGGQIIADGLSALQDNFNGSDGGGGGGAIAVSVISGLSGSPVFRVTGGEGGDEANDQFAHGTGGGGGGGAIRLFGATCAAITPVVNGGTAGTSVLGNDAGDPNWGAIDGGPGNCQGNFSALGQTSPVDPARLNVVKTSSVYTANGSSTGFSIPAEDMIYTIVVQNVGGGPAGEDSVFVIDQLPAQITFFNGDIDDGGPDNFPGSDPVAFVDNGSGLSFNYANDVAFSNQPSMPISFADCTYEPASGYDPAVTFICINPKGVFARPQPTAEFTIALRARIN